MATISFYLRLLIAPLFFILAIINFQLGQDPEIAAAGHAHLNQEMSNASGSLPAIITSMWLMYVLMGLAHITPWFGLTKAPENKAPSDY